VKLLIDSVLVASQGALQLQKELARAAARRRPQGAEVILLIGAGGPTLPSIDGLRVIEAARPGAVFGRFKWFHRDLPRLLRAERVDVVYSLSGFVTQAMLRTAGVVTTVNNMVPFTPKMTGQYSFLSKERLRNALLHRIYCRAVRHADAVVLHSQHALTQLNRAAGDITSKTRVVLTGMPASIRFDPDSPPPHPYEGKPFFFYLSAMQRYKNHLALIEGFRLAFQESPGDFPDLVIAGLPADLEYVGAVKEAIRRSGVGERCRYLPALSGAEIPALLHHAQANYFPSLCETNSVVQAEILGVHGVMACSDTPPMNEVAGGAALLFDPESPRSIADSMKRLAGDEGLREILREKSAARAKTFSWDECGDAIWRMAELAASAFNARQNIE
jgi:glycosyltransferase involved in cell wall biosynthesis